MRDLVKDSPMFDYVEEISGRPNQGALLREQDEQAKKKRMLEQAQRELEMQVVQELSQDGFGQELAQVNG